MSQTKTAVFAGVFLVGAVVALLTLMDSGEGETIDLSSGKSERTETDRPPTDATPPDRRDSSRESGEPVRRDPTPAETTKTALPVVPTEVALGYTEAEKHALARVEMLLAKIAELRKQPPARGADYFKQIQEINAQIEALLQEIVAIGDPAVRPLLDLLKGATLEKQDLLSALIGIGGDKVKGGLLGLYQSSAEYHLQRDIVAALARKWSGELQDFYTEAYQEAGDFRVKMAILKNMSDRAEPNASQFFAKAVQGEAELNVRLEAVRSLRKVRDPTTYDLLESVVLSENEPLALRQDAIYAAAATDALRAMPTLEGLATGNASLSLRASAIVALGEYYGEEAIPSLQALAQNDPSEDVRLRAERALRKIRERTESGTPVPGSLDRELDQRGGRIE